MRVSFILTSALRNKVLRILKTKSCHPRLNKYLIKVRYLCRSGIHLFPGSPPASLRALGEDDNCWTFFSRAQIILVCILLASLSVTSAEKPVVDISAKGGMEIDDTKQIIEAHQEIVVKRGNQILYADHAKARFTKGQQKKIAIQQLEVWGNVVIEELPRKIYAERAIYDIPQDTITLTGTPVTFIEPGIKMTAYDQIIYSPKAKQARALGTVKIEKENQTLMADEIIAYFEEDESQKSTKSSAIHGQTKLKKMVVKGNVKIILPDQVALANYGEHEENQGKTYLEGDVELSDSKGQIHGGYAEMTAQGVSRVLQHKPGYDKSRGGIDMDRVEALILRT